MQTFTLGYTQTHRGTLASIHTRSNLSTMTKGYWVGDTSKSMEEFMVVAPVKGCNVNAGFPRLSLPETMVMVTATTAERGNHVRLIA